MASREQIPLIGSPFISINCKRYNWNQSLEAEIRQIQVRHCADIFNAENAWFDTKVKWMNWMYMWSQTSFNNAFSFNFCEYLKNREKSSLM